MTHPSHYETLGIPPDADEAAIKRAYRKRSSKSPLTKPTAATKRSKRLTSPTLFCLIPNAAPDTTQANPSRPLAPVRRSKSSSRTSSPLCKSLTTRI